MAGTDDTQVGVKFGVEKDGVDPGLANVVSSLKSSIDAMTAKIGELGTKHSAVVPKVEEGNQRMGFSFLKLRESAQTGLDGVIGIVERFKGGIAGIAATLAGGFIGKEAIQETNEFTASVMNLAKTMGMASDTATTLVVAMKGVGLAPETYTAAFIKFERQVTHNSETLKALGVDIVGLQNGTKTTDEAFRESIGILEQYKEGHDRLQVAMQMFGARGVGDVTALLKFYHTDLQKAREETEALGLTVTEQSVAMKRDYTENLEGVHLVFEALGKVVAETIMPRLTDLAKWFREIGPSAVQITRDAMATFTIVMDGMKDIAKALWSALTEAFSAILKGLQNVFGQGGEGMTAMQFFQNVLKVISIAFVFFKTGILEAIEFIKAGIEQLVVTFSFLKEVTQRALVLDFAGAKAAWTTYVGQVKTIAKTHFDEMVKMGKDAAKQMADIATGGPAAAAPGTPTKVGGGKSAPDFGSKSTADQSEMAGWENILKAAENGYNNLKLQQGSFEVWSIQMTRDYWAQVLEFGNLSVKDRMAAENKFYDAERKVQTVAFQAYIASLEKQKAELGKNVEGKIAIEQKELDAIIQKYGEQSKEAEAAYKRMAELRQQLADQRTKIADIEQKAEQATQKHSTDMAKLEADQEVALRQISSTQRLQIEQSYVDRQYQIDAAGIQARLALIDPTRDPVKFAELNAQLLKLREDYEKQSTQIANQAELDRQKYALQASQQIESSFSTLLSDLANRTKTVKQSFIDMFDSIAQGLNKIAANKIAEQVFGGGTQGGNVLNGIFGKIFGGGPTGGAPASGATPPLVPPSATLPDGGGASAGGILGWLLGPGAASKAATQVSAATPGGSAGGLLGSIFGTNNATALTQKIAGGAGTSGGVSGLFGTAAPTAAAGAAADTGAQAALTAAVTAQTAALTAETAVDTTLTTTQTLLNTITTTFTTALASATTALATFTASLAASSAGGGGGGGGLGSLFGSLIPSFDVGTNYVPQTTLAVVHRGEAVIPAAYNTGSSSGGNHTFNTTTHVHVQGPVDTRSRNQIAAAAYEGTRRGVFKNR